MTNNRTMKKFSQRFEQHSLPWKHKQAEYSRQALKADHTLKGMMSMDRMERMELLAINNRCMSKYSKIKRAEQISKRYYKKPPFLPNVKKLKLDIKQSSPKHLKLQESPVQKDNGRPSEEDRLFEELIDDYLAKADQKLTLNEFGGAGRHELVEEACRQICKKIEERRGQIKFSTIGRRKTEGTERSTSLIKARHSSSTFQFEENLEQINKSRSYGEKVRKLNQKLFLRKLRYLNSISNMNR